MAKVKKPAKVKAKPKPMKAAPKKAAKPAAKKAAPPKKVAPVKKAAKVAAPKKAVKAAPPAKKVAPPKKVEAPKKPVKEVKVKGKVEAPKKEAKAPKGKKADEVELLDEDFTEEVATGDDPAWQADPDDVVLTDADGNPYCKAKDCDQLSAVDGYCRYHYILLWKRIQNRKKILAGGKLDRYIEELTARYPDKYLEMLRKDLASEKDFLAVVAELDIDEGLSDAEFDDDSENFIDEMRGVSREEGDEEF